MTQTQASAEHCAAAINELKSAINANDPKGKIDWTNLRLLFAELLKQLVPIILPLIIGLLEKDTKK